MFGVSEVDLHFNNREIGSNPTMAHSPIPPALDQLRSLTYLFDLTFLLGLPMPAVAGFLKIQL